MTGFSGIQIFHGTSPTAGATDLLDIDRRAAHALQFIGEQCLPLARLQQQVDGYSILFDREFDENDTILSGRIVLGPLVTSSAGGAIGDYFAEDYFFVEYFPEYFELGALTGGGGGSPSTVGDYFAEDYFFVEYFPEYFELAATSGGGGGPTTSTPRVAVPRQVYTTFDATGNLFARVNNVPGGSGTTPYSPIQSVTSIGPATPNWFNSGFALATAQHPPILSPLGGGSVPYFSPYNWHVVSGVSIADAQGAYVKGGFTGTSLTLHVDTSALVAASAASSDYPYIAVSIDGGATVISHVPNTGSGATAVVIATGLVDTTHSFSVVFESRSTFFDIWPNPDAMLRLLATPFTVDAGRAVLAPASLQPRMMLFYGASADEAFPASDPAISAPEGRGSESWVRQLANTFQAEYGIVAFSGQGILQGGAWGVPNLLNSYDLHTNGISRLTSGTYSVAPDMIVVTMGTNDVIGSYSDVTFSAAVVTLLGDLRAAAPTANIIMSADVFGSRAAAISAGVVTYQTAHSSDHKIFFSGYNTREGGVINNPALMVLGHPNVAGHAALAPVLASNFSRVLGWTTPLYQVKAENPFDITYPQYFPVDDDTGWGFFHGDGDLTHWTFTKLRLSDGHVYLPSWNTAVAGLFSSDLYEIREALHIVDDGVYPDVSPAPIVPTLTGVGAYVDADGTLIAQVSNVPAVTHMADMRAYGLYELAGGTQIGPLTYVAIPARPTIELRSQYDGLRIDVLHDTTSPQWHDTVGVDSTGRFVVRKAAGSRAEVVLVDTTTNTMLARDFTTNGLSRAFRIYPDDTNRLDDGSLAYGSAFEEVGFSYDTAVVGLALLSVAALDRTTADVRDAYYKRVRRFAYALSLTVQSDGGIPFAHFPRFFASTSNVPPLGFYRTGAMAWANYFLFKALLLLPAEYWTGAYAPWKTSVQTAANACLGWIYTQTDGLNLVRFGKGRNDPTTGIFDPTYQFTFHGTEHNIDVVFLYLAAEQYLGTSIWVPRAHAIIEAMITYHYDGALGRFYQSTDATGVPDGVSTLDSNTWGGLLAMAYADTVLAQQFYARATDLYLQTDPDSHGDPVQGFCGYSPGDGIADPASSVWIEGTAGALILARRLGTPNMKMLKGLGGLQQLDGSFRNFQKNDPTPFGIYDFRDVMAAAWYTLAVLPDVCVWTETAVL